MATCGDFSMATDTSTKPSTTLNTVPINRSHTNDSVCMRPGMVHYNVEGHFRNVSIPRSGTTSVSSGKA